MNWLVNICIRQGIPGLFSSLEMDPDDVDDRIVSCLSDIPIDSLRTGRLDKTVQDALQQYENGIKQLKQCHELLDAAEQRVTLLSGFDADGNAVTEAMEDPEAGAKRPKRATKRANRRPPEGGDSVDGTGELV